MYTKYSKINTLSKKKRLNFSGQKNKFEEDNLFKFSCNHSLLIKESFGDVKVQRVRILDFLKIV